MAARGLRTTVASVAATLALAASSLVMIPTAAHADTVTDGLVAWYKLDETSGTTVSDSSGNGRTAAVEGSASWNSGSGFTFGGGSASSGNSIKLPNNIIAGLSSITVSADVLVDASLTGNHFVYNLGNLAVGSPQSGTGYLFATTTPYLTKISNAAWANEQTTSKGSNLAKSVWKHLTYTQTGTTGTLYEDGVQVAQNTSVAYTPAQIGSGTTTRNYIGKSAYAADNSFKGVVRDFRIYSRALTGSEVQTLSAEPIAGDLAAAAESVTIDAPSALTGNIVLPSTVSGGASLSWSSSNTAVLSNSGVVTRPATGSPDQEVTLTATVSLRGQSATKQFVFTVVALPSSAESVQEDADAASIVNASDIRGNVTLPGRGSLFGSDLSWTSGNTAVVGNDGIVTRPAYGEPDVEVTLTVTASDDGESAEASHTVVVKALPRSVPNTGYAFSYFTGDSVAGEKIYFAASNGNNARSWGTVNGGQPVLTSTKGSTGLRDPFLIRSPEGDKFFLIATDLSIGGGTSWDASQRTGSKYLEVWESTDLVNWSAQRHVKVSPDTAGNTWAPEAYYDSSAGEYVVFWASKLYAESDTSHTGSTYNKMLYATTRDFVTFSETQIWQDPGTSVIDSTVLEEDGVYHRFTKDEGAATGCSDIIQERSTSLRAPSPSAAWKTVASCIGRDAGTAAVEGPSIFKANAGDVNGAGYYLFIDEYGGRGYVPLFSPSITNPRWAVPASYSLPSNPRHGTVLGVTQSELDGLKGIQTAAVTTSTELVITPASIAEGTQPEATATVTASDAGEVAGSVEVSAGNWSSTVPLVDGRAVLTLPANLPLGDTEVTASYSGYAEIPASSDSATVTVLDSIAPVTIAELSLEFRTVMLIASDDRSGVTRSEYRLGGTGAWREYVGPIAIGREETLVQFRSVDNAGNTEQANSMTVPAAAVVPAVSATASVAMTPKVQFGAAAKVSVKVTGTGAAPTGTVRLLEGARLWGTATLVAGRATVTLPKSLAPGSHTITAVYSGDGMNLESSDSVTLTVVKASATTQASVSPKKVTTSKRAKVSITVKAATGVVVSGKATVTVKRAGKTVKSTTVSVTKGKASLTLLKLLKGTYTVKVAYKGSKTVSSSSTTATIKVAK